MYISINTLDLVIVEGRLVAITAISLFGSDATSLTHLNLGYFSHSSLQILKSSVRLDGDAQLFSGTSIDLSIRFQSGLWLGH